MRSHRRYLLGLIVLLLPACGPEAGSAPSAAPAAEGARANRELGALVELMGQRLELMHDVARFKWVGGSPIEDPVREQALLEDVARRGRDLGLDEAATRAFFTAQIEAAKIVQRADFERWRGGLETAPATAPDLKGVLRPRIDALNRDLLAALAKIRSQVERLGQRPDPAEVGRQANQHLRPERLPPDARSAAIAPLLGPGSVW